MNKFNKRCNYASNMTEIMCKMPIQVLNVSISKKKYQYRRYNCSIMTNIKNV